MEFFKDCFCAIRVVFKKVNIRPHTIYPFCEASQLFRHHSFIAVHFRKCANYSSCSTGLNFEDVGSPEVGGLGYCSRKIVFASCFDYSLSTQEKAKRNGVIRSRFKIGQNISPPKCLGFTPHDKNTEIIDC